MTATTAQVKKPQLTILEQGWVHKRDPKLQRPLAMGSRLVVADDGELACSFMIQSKAAINDFGPMITRSKDNGKTWSEPQFIWPHLDKTWCLFGCIGRDPKKGGAWYMFGSRYKIDKPGETIWQEENSGLGQNELFYAVSRDNGKTWTDPIVIPMPIPGTSEAPCALQVRRDGTLMLCYSPYNNFDKNLKVERNQVVFMQSKDQGKTWSHSRMLSWDGPNDGAAEAWVVELSDGQLLGASWHFQYGGTQDYPDAYGLSSDGGKTWSKTNSTGIQGQSIALAPYKDGKALMVYNRRRHAEPGVGLALVKPTATDFGIEFNDLVWKAATATKDGTTANTAAHQWTNFAFGEPAVAVLPNGDLYVVLWCTQPDGQGIAYVRARLA